MTHTVKTQKTPPPSAPRRGRTRRRRSTLLLAGTVAAVVALAGCSDDGGSSSSSNGGLGAVGQSLPSTSAKDMLLTESEFPSLPGGEFEVTEGDTSSSTDMQIKEAECQTLLETASGGSSDADDSAEATLTAETQPDASSTDLAMTATAFSSAVARGIDDSDFDQVDELFEKCSTMTMEITEGIDFSLTLEKVDLGLDGNGQGFSMSSADSIDIPAGGTSVSVPMDFTIYGAIGTERDCGITAMAMSMAMGSAEGPSDSEVRNNTKAIYNAQRQRVLDAD